MIFELVQDFSDALAEMPREHPRRRILELYEEAVRRDIHFVERHPTSLLQCMWNTCWWYDCPEAEEHYVVPEGGWKTPQPWTNPMLAPLLGNWRTEREQTAPGSKWVRSLRPPPIHLGTAQKLVLRQHRDAVRSLAFSPDGRCIASVSDDTTVRVTAGLRTARGPPSRLAALS